MAALAALTCRWEPEWPLRSGPLFTTLTVEPQNTFARVVLKQTKAFHVRKVKMNSCSNNADGFTKHDCETVSGDVPSPL